MSIRLCCRIMPIAKGLGVLPIRSENLLCTRKFINVQPQDHNKATSANVRQLNTQVSATETGEISNVMFLTEEKLEKLDVARIMKSIEQVLINKAEQGNIDNILYSTPQKMSFDEFLKSDFIECYEQYKADPNVSILIGNEEEKIRDAYERYCITAYGDYVDSVEGKNPFTALFF